VYTWQLPFLSYDTSQSNTYNFVFRVKAQCTQMPTVRSGFKYLSYQNGNLVTTGGPSKSIHSSVVKLQSRFSYSGASGW